MSADPGFLGRGWAFPVAPAADGELALSAAEEDVRQAIRLILETEPGERVMRPDFGTGLRSLVFEPLSVNTATLVRHRVEESLRTWEPRIEVRDVTVTVGDRALGRLDVQIAYTISATNTFYNLVYPFYLQEGSA
jgi:phage baseplate assembly protein W